MSDTRTNRQGAEVIHVGAGPTGNRPSPEAFAAGEGVGKHWQDPTFERGTTGLKQYGGYIFDEPLQSLQGLKGVRVWREMADSDAIIGSMLFTIGQAIRKINVTPEAAKLPEGHPKQELASQAVEFLEGVLADMDTPLSAIKEEASSFLTFGFAPMEIVYKYREGQQPEPPTPQPGTTMQEEDAPQPSSKFEDGLIGVHKVVLRAQDTIQRWEMTKKGEMIGLWQQPWTGGPVVFIPRERFVLFRTSSLKGNPEGRSILRNSYRPWTLKKAMERIESVGIERDLAGFPIVRVPSQLITAAQAGDSKAMMIYNEYKKIVQGIRRDDKEGLVLPSDQRQADQGGGYLYDVQLLTSGSRRNFDLNSTIMRYAQEMAMSVLTDFILLGHGARGTQALATTKVDVFLDSIQGYMDMIADALTDQLVKRLWQLNGFDMEIMPKLVADNTKEVDPERLAALLGQLASSGMPIFPDPSTEEWVRDQVGLPEPDPATMQMREQQQQIGVMQQMGIDPATGLPQASLDGSLDPNTGMPIPITERPPPQGQVGGGVPGAPRPGGGASAAGMAGGSGGPSQPAPKPSSPFGTVAARMKKPGGAAAASSDGASSSGLSKPYGMGGGRGMSGMGGRLR